LNKKKAAQSPSERLKKRNKRNKVIDSDNRTLSFLLHTKVMAEERRWNGEKTLEMTIRFMNIVNNFD
jgi:hypothetical protein